VGKKRKVEQEDSSLWWDKKEKNINERETVKYKLKYSSALMSPSILPL